MTYMDKVVPRDQEDVYALGSTFPQHRFSTCFLYSTTHPNYTPASSSYPLQLVILILRGEYA